MNWNYSQRLLKGLYRQYNKSMIINCLYFFLIPKDIVEKSQLFFFSWDVGAVRNLPDYMKLCFLALFNTVNEMAYDHLKEQGEDAIPCLTKAVCSSNLMASVLIVITYIYIYILYPPKLQLYKLYYSGLIYAKHSCKKQNGATTISHHHLRNILKMHGDRYQELSSSSMPIFFWEKTSPSELLIT